MLSSAKPPHPPHREPRRMRYDTLQVRGAQVRHPHVVGQILAARSQPGDQRPSMGSYPPLLIR